MKSRTFILTIILLSLINGTKNAKENSYSNSVNISKDVFLQAAFDHEINLSFKGKKFVNADSLNFDDDLNLYGLNKFSQKTIVSYSDDPVFELFRLMKAHCRVCVNTDANSKKIGGEFTKFESFREGKGDQEESIMSLLNGSLLSLEDYTKKNSYNYIIREIKHEGAFLYKEGTFNRRILYSSCLYPRVPMDLLDKYWNDTEDFKNFFDYLVYKYSKNELEFIENRLYRCSLYSITSFDRRFKDITIIDYDRLRKETERKIRKMLLHSKFYGHQAIVITIPGSGIYSNKTFESNSEKDLLYLDCVEEGTIAAIENYGKGFKEIVICGHRSKPEIKLKD